MSAAWLLTFALAIVGGVFWALVWFAIAMAGRIGLAECRGDPRLSVQVAGLVCLIFAGGVCGAGLVLNALVGVLA